MKKHLLGILCKMLIFIESICRRQVFASKFFNALKSDKITLLNEKSTLTAMKQRALIRYIKKQWE